MIITVSIPTELSGSAVGLQVESGLYDSFRTVLNVSSLCYDLNVYPTYQDNLQCPMAGQYTLKTSYRVPTIRDYTFQYTPDVKLTFFNQQGRRVGCATTGTAALHRVADRQATRGLVALGISVVAFCVIFALLLYLSYRRKKRLEFRHQKKAAEKMSYHYFKTLPSGQVVPLPGNPPPTNAMNISNPAYNEPQIPTRPII